MPGWFRNPQDFPLAQPPYTDEDIFGDIRSADYSFNGLARDDNGIAIGVTGEGKRGYSIRWNCCNGGSSTKKL
jgi:hypothetical protein